MMIFTSVYGVIDGLFISNYVGYDAFAAVNLIFPVLMIMGSIGFMIGTGGTAIVSKILGAGDGESAKRYFSLFILATFIGGVAFAAAGEILIPYIPVWLNASENTYGYCVLYGRILLAAMPAFMLQNVFQAFFSAAEKPVLGFIVTAVAGCTNILFDGVFVGAAGFGVTGAAVATLASQVVGAVLPIIYFSVKNNSLLRFCKPKLKWKVLLNACANGSSEFVNNISSSIVSIVFNRKLMEIAGENGVDAYGVLMYVNFIYFSIFIGYSIGTAPLIGYNYGAGNKEELKNIFRKSVILVEIFGVLMTALALGLAYPISWLFVREDAALLKMTENAFYIISYMFIFAGFSVFASSMFTAFGNGLISALISFLRTIVFQIAAVLILPVWFGLTGVWVAALVPEVLAMLTSLIFVICLRKRYGYA